jgi:hypothetical protein
VQSSRSSVRGVGDLQLAGFDNVHLPPTQRAGSMQCVPVSEALHDAPSAPAAEHFPESDALHVPAAGHTATLVGMIESAPHEPPVVANVNAMHLPFVGLQPT